jgi:hypothetical protein
MHAHQSEASWSVAILEPVTVVFQREMNAIAGPL